MSRQKRTYDSRSIPGLVVLTLMAIYLVAMLFAPLFFNGHLYALNSPFPIELGENTILIRVERRSLVNAPAINHPRITCDGLQYQYPEQSGSIQKGEDILTTHLPKPHVLKGECIIEGFVEYEPIPFLVLKHEYYSEPFTLD